MDIICNRFSHQVFAALESVWYANTSGARAVRRVAFGAAVVTVAAFGCAEGALAATSDLRAYGKEVSGKTNVITDIVSYICYIGGAILSGLGVVELKKHVENPSQTPMKNGLAKLGFGGVLLALPFVSGVMAGTMAGSAESAQFVPFKSTGTI